VARRQRGDGRRKSRELRATRKCHVDEKLRKRELATDPVYGSTLVTKFINTVMRDGKRSTAEGILYGSLDIIKDRTGDDPLQGLQEGPRQRQADARGQVAARGRLELPVPIEVAPNRRLSLAIRWLVSYARSRGDGKTMEEKLANELLDASNLRGGAVKKREDTHRMAEANKAFAHYRW